MKKENLYEAIGEIDEKYIRTAHALGAPKKSVFIKYGAVAACLVLLAALPIVWNRLHPGNIPGDTDTDDTQKHPDIVNHTVSLEDLHRPYKDVTVLEADLQVAWQWEYLTIYEKYPSIEIDGVQFIRMGKAIRADAIGEKLGSYEAIGYNYPYDTPQGGYRESFDAYRLLNISSAYMVALKMEDQYYCYISDTARGEIRDLSWGDVWEQYGLSSAITFDAFTQYTNGKEANYFSLHDDAYIQEILTSCKDASAVNPSEWKNDGNYVSFSVTSDIFGIYKKSFRITESGYIWTNILEVECVYYIGEDAAGKILSYALNNADVMTQTPFYPTVVGTITEITQTYICIDDSVLCETASDGITFKILLNDLRINRYVQDGRIHVGDIVAVVYEGGINTADGYTIDTAISAEQAILSENGVLIPE